MVEGEFYNGAYKEISSGVSNEHLCNALENKGFWQVV